jgi:hypothetical protein
MSHILHLQRSVSPRQSGCSVLRRDHLKPRVVRNGGGHAAANSTRDPGHQLGARLSACRHRHFTVIVKRLSSTRCPFYSFNTTYKTPSIWRLPRPAAVVAVVPVVPESERSFTATPRRTDCKVPRFRWMGDGQSDVAVGLCGSTTAQVMKGHFSHATNRTSVKGHSGSLSADYTLVSPSI